MAVKRTCDFCDTILTSSGPESVVEGQVAYTFHYGMHKANSLHIQIKVTDERWDGGDRTESCKPDICSNCLLRLLRGEEGMLLDK